MQLHSSLPASALLALLLACTTALQAQENTSLLCADGIDNDGDGLIDCADDDCAGLSGGGCSTCTDGASFADVVYRFLPGCATVDTDSTGALGVSDYESSSGDADQFVFLGQGGRLQLGFTDNALINSGTEDPDLWVFEIGPIVEPCVIGVRPFDEVTRMALLAAGIPDADSNGYFEIDTIRGSRSSVDIDEKLPGFGAEALRFDAVEVIDVADGSCSGRSPGADIDAVCALSSVIVSAEETLAQRSLVVSPTHAREYVSVRWDEGYGQTVAGYTISDLSGRRLLRGDLRSGGRVEVSSLASGVYAVSVEVDGGYVTRRILKQ